MGFGKGNKLAGSRRGKKNRRTLLIEEIASKYPDPFEVLLMIAAGDWKGLGYEAECYFSEKPDGAVKMGYVISPELRATAAKEATQYIHPKRKEEVHEEDEPIEVLPLEEKKKLLIQAKKEISSLEEEVRKEEVLLGKE